MVDEYAVLTGINREEYIVVGTDGKLVKKDLYVSKPRGFQLSSGCMMNGIPSECVPEDVYWDEINKEWKVIEGYGDDIQTTIEDEVVDWKDEYQRRDDLEFPCWTSAILYTKEYYFILEKAGLCQEEMDRNLDWKMRVLRWIHQSNMETVIRYNKKEENGEIVTGSLNIVWEKLGMRIGRRVRSWKLYNTLCSSSTTSEHIDTIPKETEIELGTSIGIVREKLDNLKL